MSTSDTRFDRLLRKPKEHPVIAVILVIGVVLTALGQFTEAIGSLARLVAPESADDAPTPDRMPHRTAIEGRWILTDRIREASYRPFIGMEVQFSLRLTVDGDRISGFGEKESVNGQRVESVERSTLEVNGTLDGNKLIAQFKETGRKRVSTGEFVWVFDSEFQTFIGSFESSAATTKGSSRGFKAK